MLYRVVEYDSGPKGMPGMEALINEKAAEGYALVQAVPRNAYPWVLIFALKADVEQLGSSPAS
ncbi:hypothetical protein CN204_12575 [Sinorhizobium meliloti]|nr:hypothetical protein [Sinorhizobium meliloti]RVH85086.1 hypothetical protein CN204_12575 [Sinorhizobium meliloti]RVO07026.1 hypothetical protein CN102_14485 [Sinorhizobium meliloti]